MQLGGPALATIAIGAFNLSEVGGVTSQTDWDQGGTTRQLRKIYLGPSLGWLHFPGNQILTVTQAGTVNVSLGVTLIEVNVAGLVTLRLPSSQTTGAGAQAIPGQFVGAPITIVDISGNAAGFPISIIPAGAETIDGLALAQITTAYGAAILTPNFPSSNWTLTSATQAQAQAPHQLVQNPCLCRSFDNPTFGHLYRNLWLCR